MDSTSNNILKKYGHLRIVLGSSMMKKTAAELKNKGKKINPHTNCVVNSCQERLLEFFFLLNNSIHQLALALDVTQVYDGRNLF